MEITLRELAIQDEPMMAEWMQDEDIVKNFNVDFRSINKIDRIQFIENGSKTSNSIHRAIIDNSNEYLGTVSLKNIDSLSKRAEYAIVLRRKAIGKGVAKEATKEILRKAFVELELEEVFLTVLCTNRRAIMFYEKSGFIKQSNGSSCISHYSISKTNWVESLGKELK